jgi:hypothetical protein
MKEEASSQEASREILKEELSRLWSSDGVRFTNQL